MLTWSHAWCAYVLGMFTCSHTWQIMVWQLRNSCTHKKCMLTDLSLKVKIIKINNKYHDFFFEIYLTF